MPRALPAALVTLALLGFPRGIQGQASAPGPRSGTERRLEVEEATRAYLARITPAQKARSDSYFEGGYWLRLWDFLYGVSVAWLVLAAGWSARMRGLAERAAPGKASQTFLYWVEYSVLTAVLLFPLTFYEGFVREHKYGLVTQSFGPWLGDRLKALAVAAVFGGLCVTLLYGVLRRAPRTWWIWGALTASGLVVFSDLLAPVYFAPLFNSYTPLEDARIRDPILSLARANGIGVEKVYVVDASRQTTRISANVSGLFGTRRISLNDNLLKRCSLEEIEAVMGHEMGHYVLHHLYKGVVFTSILILLGFAFCRAGFEGVTRRRGTRWGVRGVADPAGLPVFVILISCYLFALTPVTNSITRIQESEADIFGLNASRQPDGFAETALKVSDYRKLDPTRLEEMVFYDHPSGRTRIFTAMRWKAEHAGEGR
jgi:STE24 endopeptidase